MAGMMLPGLFLRLSIKGALLGDPFWTPILGWISFKSIAFWLILY